MDVNVRKEFCLFILVTHAWLFLTQWAEINVPLHLTWFGFMFFLIRYFSVLMSAWVQNRWSVFSFLLIRHKVSLLPWHVSTWHCSLLQTRHQTIAKVSSSAVLHCRRGQPDRSVKSQPCWFEEDWMICTVKLSGVHRIKLLKHSQVSPSSEICELNNVKSEPAFNVFWRF